MKEILLISNLDLQSNDVLKYAAEFCKHYQTKLHVLHFNHKNTPVLLSSHQTYQSLSNDIYHFERKNDLIEKITRIVSPFIDHDWLSITVQSDVPSIALEEFINNREIDLILLRQTHFTRHSREIENCIKNILTREITIPMLVIPPFYVFEPYERINYLLKYFNDNNISNLKSLTNWFSEIPIDLTHLHKAFKLEHSIKDFDNWVKYAKKETRTDLRPILEESSLDDFINRENNSIIQIYDLIVFSTYNRNFWERIYDPSSTLRVLGTLDLPTLIFKNGKSVST